MRRRVGAALCAGALVLAFEAPALAHEMLDHPAPPVTTDAPVSTTVNSGGEGAEWELITSIPTGNPHTDLDFFTQGGDIFASVGTLAVGPNAGGQTIIRLTEGGEIAPRVVSAHPSASCVSDPDAALGLQHDVEAAPKGEALLGVANPHADTSDTQLIVDATDAPGRCHDQGILGLELVPPGGLEIVDVTDIANPVELSLTSHIGEAHTVNVDPKRPHIAYAVTSDEVGLDDSGTPNDPSDDVRTNEDPDEDPLNLDGFEIVDMSSCMNFPEGTTVDEKRDKCRPKVYRYRYPSIDVALGHTWQGSVFACHELEIYPDDRLTCASGGTMIMLDMSDAFDDNGTPNDYSDDHPRGKPLPCQRRDSSTAVPFLLTGAKVTDCVEGKDGADLTVPGWLEMGAPSVKGVRWIGSAYHQGGFETTHAPSEDIYFDHEAELTASGDFVLATDERGGGVLPPHAACQPAVDTDIGNGGIHAYAVDRLQKKIPESPEEAWESYALTPEGDKAIYRAEIHTVPQETLCTSHVFQQIPGQNRMFMGWYSQGTQVVDFIEHPDGTFEWKSAGYFIPENANTWTSHIFKYEENEDGTFTYYGATGDFNLGVAGRSTIDVYKVTLPAPPLAAVELPSPKAQMRLSDRTPKRGERLRVRAFLKRCEGHEGTRMKLLRKKGDQEEYKRIARKKLNSECRTKFWTNTNFKTAEFRTVWPKQDDDHRKDRSKPRTVTTH